MLPVQTVLPRALVQLLAQAPSSPGKLQFAWKAAVGPAISRVTTVTVEDRRLIVRAAGPLWRREVERSLPVIRERLAALLGADAIAGVDLIES